MHHHRHPALNITTTFECLHNKQIFTSSSHPFFFVRGFPLQSIHPTTTTFTMTPSSSSSSSSLPPLLRILSKLKSILVSKEGVGKGKFDLLFFAFSFVLLCLVSTTALSNQAYVEENGLLLGSTKTGFDRKNGERASTYSEMLMNTGRTMNPGMMMNTQQVAGQPGMAQGTAMPMAQPGMAQATAMPVSTTGMPTVMPMVGQPIAQATAMPMAGGAVASAPSATTTTAQATPAAASASAMPVGYDMPL